MTTLLLPLADGSTVTVITAAIAAATTGLGSWLVFRGQKQQSTAEAMVAERAQLSSEWTEFRSAVDKALEDCRTENVDLRKQIRDLNNEVRILRAELRSYRGGKE